MYQHFSKAAREFSDDDDDLKRTVELTFTFGPTSSCGSREKDVMVERCPISRVSALTSNMLMRG